MKAPIKHQRGQILHDRDRLVIEITHHHITVPLYQQLDGDGVTFARSKAIAPPARKERVMSANRSIPVLGRSMVAWQRMVEVTMDAVTGTLTWCEL